MSGLLLDHDPLTGITRTFHFDPVTEEATIHSTQDVTPILEAAKGNMNLHDERARWGDGKHVAFIPPLIFFDLMRKGIVDDDAAFKRWLNDPDNRCFRTFPGRV